MGIEVVEYIDSSQVQFTLVGAVYYAITQQWLSGASPVGCVDSELRTVHHRRVPQVRAVATAQQAEGQLRGPHHGRQDVPTAVSLH